MTLSHNKLQKFARSYGLKLSASACQPINHLYKNFLKQHSNKKNRNMTGGSAPMEWFGIDSAKYYAPDQLPGGYNGLVMNTPTETISRPALELNPIPKGSQIGGRTGVLSDKDIKDCVDNKLSKPEVLVLKKEAEKFVGEIFKSVRSKCKTGEVSDAELDEIVKMKKFKKYS